MYRIMIVDDEDMIRTGIQMMIDRETCQIGEIVTARNGEEALKLIKESPPEILITDIRMPKMDGISLVKNIREMGVEIHVLVLSGYDDFEYVRSMMRMGVENYLLKPVNEEELNRNIYELSEKLKYEQKERQREWVDQNLIRENVINRWLYGSIGEKELLERAAFLGFELENRVYQPFLLKGLGEEWEQNWQLRDKTYEICLRIIEDKQVYFSRNYNGEVIGIICRERDNSADEIICNCMDVIKKELGIKIYALIGKEAEGYWSVSHAFLETVKNAAFYLKSREDMILKRNESGFVEDSGQMSPMTVRMANYAMEHYQEEISLKTLGQYFKANTAYMGQIFKKDTGQNFSDYVKILRIKKAKELLINEGYKIKEIGILVGFLNDTYFSATFKKETGLSPAEYRREFLK